MDARVPVLVLLRAVGGSGVLLLAGRTSWGLYNTIATRIEAESGGVFELRPSMYHLDEGAWIVSTCTIRGLPEE